MLSVQTLIRETQVSPRETSRKRFRKDHERRILAEAMDSLPETTRVVLGLRYYESLTRRQIATLLSMEEEEVGELLTQAMQRVVHCLDQEMQPAADSAPAPRRRPGRSSGRERDA